MLSNLTVKNFKSLEEINIEFGNLTLLAGVNNSGKSSIFQGLMLLRQSYLSKDLEDGRLSLNGSLVNLGSASDTLFRDASEDLISFDIECKDQESAHWEFVYSEPGADFLESQEDLAVNSKIYAATNLFNIQKFIYLSADRNPPEATFPMSDREVLQNKQLGKRGQYTTHFLSVYERQKIPNNRLAHSDAISFELKHQVEAWLGEICPGIKIQATLSPDIQQARLQFLEGMGEPYSPLNIGFGLTYILPVIVSLLFAEPGSLVLIENPEAHLHPKGQSKIGELIGMAAGCGVQVLIETHSDHVLNGMRKAVLGKKLAPTDFRIYYLSKEKKDLTSITLATAISIDENGKLDDWPKGFFDQIDKDSLALM